MTREGFHRALNELRDDLLRMGTLVETALERALAALMARDGTLARQVIADDDQVDALELAIEGACWQLVALQQPLASDLRLVGTALKAITDLERMADHAVDIAKVARRLEGQEFIKPLVDIPRMAAVAREMVRDALSAYIRQDVDLAYAMIRRDHELDALHKQVFRDLLLLMTSQPGSIEQATQLLFVSSHLERIGDHATNIGEWVIYMVTGERKELND